jgi:hypothetical protein
VREVVDALMIANVIVVLDEGADLPFEVASISCLVLPIPVHAYGMARPSLALET